MGILILVLIIMGVVAIFSVQNSAPVAISFLFWKFEASLAIVIFLSLLVGIILASVVIFWLRLGKDKKEKKSIKQNIRQ